MGDENGRRESDTKLALIEQKMDLLLESFETRLNTLTVKLDRYNGTRERIDALCLEFKDHKTNHGDELREHKANHWQMIGLSVAITGIVVSIIFKVL